MILGVFKGPMNSSYFIKPLELPIVVVVAPAAFFYYFK